MSLLKPIRDLTVTTLAAAGVAGGNVKAARHRPIRRGSLPMAAVYVDADDMLPTGDASAGHVEFRHNATVRIEVAVEAQGDEPGDDDILDAVHEVQAALFESVAWTAGVSGVERCTVATQHATEGEVRFIAAAIAVTVSFDSGWEPTITDDLEIISGRSSDARGVDLHEPDGEIETEVHIPIETD